MNINRINPADAVFHVSGERKAVKTGAVAGSDSIQVSEAAKSAAVFKVALDAAMASPDVRADRVAEVKAKINAPGYFNDKIINETADSILSSLGF